MTVYAAFNELDGVSAVTDTTNIYGEGNLFTFLRRGRRSGISLRCTGFAVAGTYYCARDFTPLAAGWVGYVWLRENDAGTGTAVTARHFALLDDTGAPILELRAQNDLSGEVRMHFMGGSAVGAPLPTPRAATSRIDVRWVCHDTLGRVEVWVNGMRHHVFTGDTLGSGATGASECRWYATSHRNASLRVGVIGDVIVSDRSTKGSRVNTLSLESYQASTLTGIVTNYNHVNIADGTSVTGNSNGQQAVHNHPANDRPPAASLRREAVVFSVRARYEASSPVEGVSPIVRKGGTNYVGSRVPVTTAYTGVQMIMHTNPATSAAWASGDFSGDLFGFRVVT